VVNLRGVIVPIVDMRMKLNLEKANYDDFTVVIVLNIAPPRRGHAVVDAVSDVMQLGGDRVKPAPEMASSSVDTTYITGIGSIAGEGQKDRMLILVDIEALMSSAEMGLMEQAAAA
jgi:purine-binding chemotaxis protein CheW